MYIVILLQLEMFVIKEVNLLMKLVNVFKPRNFNEV